MQCLGEISGACGLPRRLDLSFMCAGRVPVVPTVGAVLAYLCLVPWWHRVQCDACVVSWLYAWTAQWLVGCCLRLVHRCWPVLVAWRFLCVCALCGFLHYFLIAYACLNITSLCHKDHAVGSSDAMVYPNA